MTKVGLLVRLEAKHGKEQEVEDFLRSGLPIVQNEPETITWYAIRIAESSFGIFDTFPNDAARNTHLSGQLAAALMSKAEELLATPPSIEKIEVIAAKLYENKK
ncbi:TPA: antibiotic biosynthesis monooxygenase [Legionella pneumophila]|nr:antibiotic biosynthesis monooxygenase [Legionella pneumophila]